MKDLDWMSNFKVRFGWGVVGNDRITNYLSMDLYTDNKYGIGNNTVTVLTPKQLKNSDLKWEGSSTVNLGLDLGFFDNRLNLTADFFIKKHQRLIIGTVIGACHRIQFTMAKYRKNPEQRVLNSA